MVVKSTKKKKSLKSLSSFTVDAVVGEETYLVLYSGRDSEPMGLELHKLCH